MIAGLCLCLLLSLFGYQIALSYIDFNLVHQFVKPIYQLLILVLQCLVASHAPKAGTDVLLDLLSIGTPAQSNSSPPDILSSSKDNKLPVSTSDGLSRPPSQPVHTTSSGGAASMMDLLDGFVSNSPKPGKFLSKLKILL